MIIRDETPEDRESVHRVNELAFPTPGEANLVDALRERARPYISLIAIAEDRVVGHIFFSPVTIESATDSFTAMGLAPMAVLPEHQRQGIGTLLVREGLRECQRIGHEVVVVLGHPEYYPRFGFVPASLKGLRSEYDVRDEVFMLAELTPGALKGRTGLVKYRSEFNAV